MNAFDDLVVAADGRHETPGSLVSVLFHSLYESRAELGNEALAPNQNVTVADFRGFVEEMLENGYTVVSPAEIDAGLAPGRRYLSITFDDGYFNNTLALNILEQFRVSATFFVSTDHVQQNKAFWWDSFSRELSRRGITGDRQKAEIERVKVWTPEQIDDHLCRRFGPTVFEPRGDMDRPFSAHELRQFASVPWVHIGNHTHNHAILTNCTPNEMTRQIRSCQDALAELVGYCPIAIAYPNGNHSPSAVSAAMAAGLRVGFTVQPSRPRLPLAGETRMLLGRFLFHGGRDIARQCRLFGARLVPSHALKSLMRSRY